MLYILFKFFKSIYLHTSSYINRFKKYKYIFNIKKHIDYY